MKITHPWLWAISCFQPRNQERQTNNPNLPTPSCLDYYPFPLGTFYLWLDVLSFVCVWWWCFFFFNLTYKRNALSAHGKYLQKLEYKSPPNNLDLYEHRRGRLLETGLLLLVQEYYVGKKGKEYRRLFSPLVLSLSIWVRAELHWKWPCSYESWSI